MQTGLMRSSVFRLILLSSASFMLIALVVIWIMARLALSGAQERDREDIIEQREWMVELYQEEGLQALVDEVTEEHEPIWDEEEIYFFAEEEEVFFQIRDADREVIAGYPYLRAEEGWSVQRLDAFDIDRPLVLYKTTSEQGHQLILAKFRNHEYYAIKEFQSVSTFFLVVIALPLSLITGFFVSRKVFRRLQVMSDTAEKVGSGDLLKRIHLKGSQDEFDRLAMNINDMLDNLAALQRNIESVSVGIAHDLKTPVTQLNGRLQMIRQDADNPEAVNRHLDAAHRNINKILTTFNALLRLGEIEAGKRRKGFKQFDLSALASDIAESYEPVFQDSGRTLDVSILKDIHIIGDEDLFAQLIINLLENIIEHSREGAHAWIRLQLSKEGAILQIGDDGPGIPKEHKERIFERFYRVDASRSKGGNGLGLSLVKSICDLHDAEVVLLDNHKGAVFDIYISVNLQEALPSNA